MIDENLKNSEEFYEEYELFRDKIFDNKFGQSELDTRDKTFNLDSSFVDRSLEDKIDESLYYDQVKAILIENPKYERFNKPSSNGNFLKINKVDINDMFKTVLENVKGIKNIEAFSIITSIYDISPEKFYESLSNKFKSDLIMELKNRGYLKNRKSLF